MLGPSSSFCNILTWKPFSLNLFVLVQHLDVEIPFKAFLGFFRSVYHLDVDIPFTGSVGFPTQDCPRFCHEIQCPSETQYTLLTHDADGCSAADMCGQGNSVTPCRIVLSGKPRRGSTVSECCKEAKCADLDGLGMGRDGKGLCEALVRVHALVLCSRCAGAALAVFREDCSKSPNLAWRNKTSPSGLGSTFIECSWARKSPLSIPKKAPAPPVFLLNSSIDSDSLLRLREELLRTRLIRLPKQDGSGYLASGIFLSTEADFTCSPSSQWKSKAIPKLQGGSNEACCQPLMCQHHTCQGFLTSFSAQACTVLERPKPPSKSSKARLLLRSEADGPKASRRQLLPGAGTLGWAWTKLPLFGRLTPMTSSLTSWSVCSAMLHNSTRVLFFGRKFKGGLR